MMMASGIRTNSDAISDGLIGTLFEVSGTVRKALNALRRVGTPPAGYAGKCATLIKVRFFIDYLTLFARSVILEVMLVPRS